jgi:integrase
MVIGEIRSKDIRAWVRDMAAKKASDTRGERTLSPASVRRSFALISAIFTAAIEDELIETNPCVGVRIPKRADGRATEDDLTYLNIDEQRALVSCEKTPIEHRIAIRFALATGLRQGEQFSLRIADVHLDGDSPHVYVRYGSPFLPPKSGKPRRVPLFGDGLAVAKEAVELAKQHPNNPHQIVFPTPQGSFRGVGKPLGRKKVDGQHVCAWKASLKLAGVRDIKWHALRHTAATNLVTGVLGRRWTLEEVQPFLGHADMKVTQIYAKVGDDALKRAARETSQPAAANLGDTRSVMSEGPTRVRDHVWRLMRRVQRIFTRAA